MTYSPTNAKIWNRKLRQVGHIHTKFIVQTCWLKSFLNQFTTNSAVIKKMLYANQTKNSSKCKIGLGLLSQNN
jgi:hypothetical protein